MRAFQAFVKKELLESHRSYKLWIIVIIFLSFGIMSPLTAKLMPVLFEQFMPEGVVMEIPEPTAIDSWLQFYKNISQLGIVLFIILFSATLSSELSKGTLILMLTKGLSRKTVIWSKAFAISLIWTISYALAFWTTFAYTSYYWDMSIVQHFYFAAFCLWLFGIFMIALFLLGNVLATSTFMPMLFTGIVFALLLLLSIFEKIKTYNPLHLATNNVQLLTGAMAKEDFTIAIWLTITGIFIMLFSSIAIFNKKQL